MAPHQANGVYMHALCGSQLQVACSSGLPLILAICLLSFYMFSTPHCIRCYLQSRYLRSRAFPTLALILVDGGYEIET